MPFDTGTISILESERLMANAPWIERYLVGIAYNVFASPYVSPSYDVLDQNTASYEMSSVVNHLNAELNKLGFSQAVQQCSTVLDMVNNLRVILKNSQRANYLDWLVGNENEWYWEEAKEQEAWKLDDAALLAFCNKLREKNKAVSRNHT